MFLQTETHYPLPVTAPLHMLPSVYLVVLKPRPIYSPQEKSPHQDPYYFLAPQFILEHYRKTFSS